jgi:6-phosphogluconolactonase (cycloisomerase 2 family)
VYCPGFAARSLNVFARDPATGALTHVETLVDAAQFNGAVALVLSPDGKQAAAASFGSKTVALFSRDAETGKLTPKAVLSHDPAAGVAMPFPIDAVFSPDSKFLYVIDDQGASVQVFDVSGGKLTHLETQAGENNSLAGARGIAVFPDGKTVVVAASRAGALTVFSRDPATGRLMLKQVLADERDGIHALGGAFGVQPSDDGKFLYVASGRFLGDQAVSVYRLGEDGKLQLVQEIVNDKGELVDFRGGNRPVLSPDGKRLYVTGTVSCSLACFSRDSSSGKLTFLATIRDESTGAGAKLGANGAAFSPDGKHLYVSLEDGKAISVFERSSQ